MSAEPAPETPVAPPTVASALTVEGPKPEPKTVAFDPVTAAQHDGPKSKGTWLSQLFTELPAIIKAADYDEMWGVDLKDSSHVPTTIVLEKFLRANTNNVAKAKEQLIEALSWRKGIKPLNLLADVEYDASKFGGLGYVTVYEGKDGKRKEIVTWNIYGAVKDNKATFGNVEEYVYVPSYKKIQI
jgi:hypothetical protein